MKPYLRSNSLKSASLMRLPRSGVFCLAMLGISPLTSALEISSPDVNSSYHQWLNGSSIKHYFTTDRRQQKLFELRYVHSSERCQRLLDDSPNFLMNLETDINRCIPLKTLNLSDRKTLNHFVNNATSGKLEWRMTPQLLSKLPLIGGLTESSSGVKLNNIRGRVSANRVYVTFHLSF